MSSLNVYHGIGNVASVNTKELEERTITTITVAVNYMDWKNGENVKETLWFDLTAFSRPSDKYNKAQAWAEKFAKGQQVHISGNPKLNIYQRKDGSPGVSIKLDNPVIDFTQRPKPTEETEEVF
jgi:single-stranded DNA-binding protein